MKYNNLVSGQTQLESSLHRNLTEHLNSEIALGTITNLETSKQWIRGSFLYQRMQRNPDYYGLNKRTGQTWQGRLDELVADSIGRLEGAKILRKQDETELFSCTEYGVLMSKVSFSIRNFIGIDY